LESTYAPKVRNRIIPGLGKHRLDRLTPEHLERFYTRLEGDGLAPATVLQIHRILSRALKVAMQRGYVTRVATLVDAPSVSQAEIEPLTLDEAQRIIELAARRRNGTRNGRPIGAHADWDEADRIGQALWGSPDSPGTSIATRTATKRLDGSAKR
jgi:integrase